MKNIVIIIAIVKEDTILNCSSIEISREDIKIQVHNKTEIFMNLGTIIFKISQVPPIGIEQKNKNIFYNSHKKY